MNGAAPRIASIPLLTRLGVFVEPDFLPADTCRQIAADMIRDARTGGGKFEHGAPIVGRDTKRGTEVVREAQSAAVAAQLDALTARVASRVAMNLSGHERPLFYRYEPGDFYRAHRDSYTAGDVAAAGHDRRLSIVIFLNDGSDDAPPAYAGGDLVLYDVLGAGLEEFGVAVPARTGMLVAFDPGLRHEVTLVTSGVRCVAVSRFY
jgi:predicted 2-oxoglutarate/Fe(II)-dependent dioxygenase YbiX